ncbi:hypothetical protein ACFLQR_01320 [Verrucomicrobiota bacterium]
MRKEFCRVLALPAWFVLAAVFLVHANFVEAATRTWTAGAAGNWNTGGNWSGGAVPGSGDDVVFDNSSSANSTVNVDVVINKLTVSNYTGSIVFATGVSADLTISNDFYFGTGATIIPTYSSTSGNGTGRIITVEGNAFILGTINGDGRGFPGGQGPGGSGGAAVGGTYGGKGGGNGDATYGSTNQPTALGSGGSTTTTAAGGGAFKLIVTGVLTLNGTVTAKGANHTYGGGSGGSIWLISDTFAGNGTIIADGGIALSVHPDWPGGGGGRLAIEYTSSTFTGSVSVAGGAHYNKPGQPGTLWEPKRFLGLEGSEGNPEDITIDESYQYCFTNAAPTNYWNLTVTDGKWVEFHDGSLDITDLILTTDDTILRFDKHKGGTDDFDMESLSITGSIHISDESSLMLSAEGTYNLSGDLDILSANSILYVFGNTTGNGTGVTINCQNANILGTLSGNGCGFAGGAGPGAGANIGGAYGGKGGRNSVATYGSTNQPTALGSGGHTAAGGGAVKLIVSNTLTVNGTVSAKGNNAVYGGGAGGSIWLIADTFAGNGTITADGGIATQSHEHRGSGGGGRVAIEYTSSTFTGSVSVAGGTHDYHRGQPGTLWEPKRFVGLEGSATSPEDMNIGESYQYCFTSVAPTNYWNLTLTNGNWVEFHDGSLCITDLILTNDDTILRFDKHLGGTDDFDMESLSITGSIHILNKSSLMLSAEGTYNLSGDLDILSTNSIVYVFGNTTVTNEQSGGSAGKEHGIGVTINCQNATVLGTINGYALGFPGSSGPGGHSRGGAYGGMGGKNALPTYGSLTQPTALGSGGSTGPGGGAVKLNVGSALTLNGTVTAKGSAGSYGGGAGGSIWLISDTFAGNGTINAEGAIGPSDNVDRGSGGGGRVAVEYTSSTFTGSVSVAGGTHDYYPGKTGTLFSCESPCVGGNSSGCDGMTLDSTFGKDGGDANAPNGVKITRMITTWIRRAKLGRSTLAWSDNSTDLGLNQLDNVATNDLKGLPGNTRYNIYDNGVPVCTITSDASGDLSFTVDLTNGVHNILVEHPVAGVALYVR